MAALGVHPNCDGDRALDHERPGVVGEGGEQAEPADLRLGERGGCCRELPRVRAVLAQGFVEQLPCDAGDGYPVKDATFARVAATSSDCHGGLSNLPEVAA